MNILTITYLVIMALGVAWVIYRIAYYVRAQRERDNASQYLFSEEQFRAYLDDLRNRTGGTEGPVPPKPPNMTSLPDRER